jgi:hypothetical protein
MIYTRNVLTKENIEHIFDLYHTLPNRIIINDFEQDRYYASNTGHFMIAEYTLEEFDDILKDILDRHGRLFDNVNYIRVLKYNATCFIPKHKDAYNSNLQKSSSKSSIIQLNSPNFYIGGNLIIDENITDLQPGDMVTYSFGVVHEVKKVHKGIRYVLNIRHN